MGPLIIMPSTIDPYLTESDLVILENLFRDKSKASTVDLDDAAALARLQALNDHSSPQFQPTVFTTWDEKDIPVWLNKYLVRPYTNVAKRIVRHPTDVVFLTHILLYLSVNLTSAIYLYLNFSYIHGVSHAAFTFWCAGAFTLMLHNHIHNGGVLSSDWYWLDVSFPYILEPLMGHTWDSYYYHHVKHHHVEGNGPDDLSSTIRYQRDDLFNFLQYLGRFLFLVWYDLPMYFIRKRKTGLAVRAFTSEMLSYGFLYFMFFHVNSKAAIFTLVIPYTLLRLGLMVGNWGQHALVDEVEPDSDFRSSITLLDVPSNRFCFNDGYHTAHHLNPRRHWREHPVHFLQSKQAYSEGRALVFHNIDYLMMTVKLLQKDYDHLANCLVPIGDQVKMTKKEIADMLRTKTRKFSEEDIQKKFKPSFKAADMPKKGTVTP
ncbi:hypothetical protein KVT40_004673 [Elsinoe batatas]|uniref:Fatty acid desaturase domain-containing protein n=1 Tax=Elsinoe batatas TaxID=2601811 RepID=A0A8K0L499_9PEZI|nr:hypothetical protein KVT40_004673 [Elsinoe batatas]